MTKIMEWLVSATLFFVIWIAVITANVKSPFLETWQKSLYYLPIYVLAIFILYATVDVFYNVFNLRDCKDAAIELQRQIQQAQEDLENKGIQLRTKQKNKTKTN